MEFWGLGSYNSRMLFVFLLWTFIGFTETNQISPNSGPPTFSYLDFEGKEVPFSGELPLRKNDRRPSLESVLHDYQSAFYDKFDFNHQRANELRTQYMQPLFDLLREIGELQNRLSQTYDQRQLGELRINPWLTNDGVSLQLIDSQLKEIEKNIDKEENFRKELRNSSVGNSKSREKVYEDSLAFENRLLGFRDNIRNLRNKYLDFRRGLGANSHALYAQAKKEGILEGAHHSITLGNRSYGGKLPCENFRVFAN